MFSALDRSQQKRTMLFVDNCIQAHDQYAGAHINYEYLKIFVEMGFKITFWPDNLVKTEPYASELQQMGVEVIYGTADFKDYIRNHGKHIDVAYLSRPVSVNYIDDIRNYSDAKIVYFAHDLFSVSLKRRAELENNAALVREANNLKAVEFYLMRKSDATVLLSEPERAAINAEDPKINAIVVPWIQSLNGAKKGFEEKADLLFIGWFGHLPNEDAVLWFANEIFPLIKKDDPDIRFFVLGGNPAEKILKLRSDDVAITGYVKDVSDHFQNARIFVAPLRYGAGFKGKIAQAMSYGLPVITTSIGAEGMDLKDGENVLIADGPKEFARKVIDSYNDEDLWNKLSRNSIRYIEKHCAPHVAREKLSRFFSKLLRGRRGRVFPLGDRR